MMSLERAFISDRALLITDLSLDQARGRQRAFGRGAPRCIGPLFQLHQIPRPCATRHTPAAIRQPLSATHRPPFAVHRPPIDL